MATILERLRDATNAHDAGLLATFFAQDYRSTQPLHPSRGFGGSSQVLENWSSVCAGVPDFNSELVGSPRGWLALRDAWSHDLRGA